MPEKYQPAPGGRVESGDILPASVKSAGIGFRSLKESPADLLSGNVPEPHKVRLVDVVFQDDNILFIAGMHGSHDLLLSDHRNEVFAGLKPAQPEEALGQHAKTMIRGFAKPGG